MHVREDHKFHQLTSKGKSENIAFIRVVLLTRYTPEMKQYRFFIFVLCEPTFETFETFVYMRPEIDSQSARYKADSDLSSDPIRRSIRMLRIFDSLLVIGCVVSIIIRN